MMLHRAALLDRAHRKAAHELAGYDDAENNHRQGDQGAGRHDLAPRQFVAAQKTGGDNRGGLGVAPSEDQRVKKFVPGKNKTENGRDSDARRS